VRPWGEVLCGADMTPRHRSGGFSYSVLCMDDPCRQWLMLYKGLGVKRLPIGKLIDPGVLEQSGRGEGNLVWCSNWHFQLVRELGATCIFQQCMNC